VASLRSPLTRSGRNKSANDHDAGHRTGMPSGEHKRLMVRRDRITVPFVWRGLLPVLGLLVLGGYAVGPFANDVIEGTIDSELRHALGARGHGWVELNTRGQTAVLSGVPPHAGASEEAVSLAQSTLCTTWMGRKPCADAVEARFSGPSTSAGALVYGPKPATLPPTSPHTAQGAAASAVAPASPAVVGPRAAPAVVDPPTSQSGNAVLDGQAAAQACEARMTQLLAEASIEFAYATATLSSQSSFLLDDLAREAKRCPGVVRIEAHTDIGGTPAKNKTLSTDRAFAVRDALVARGLDAARVVAEGYGSTQPLSKETSPQALAANRRIEFRVVDSAVR
jgi:outer membrane protein OmpA-like peptidoglycan-associated protein